MIIKLLAKQVPEYWEAIKFAVVHADEVDQKDIQAYCNELLHKLLSEQAQCFVNLDAQRKLKALLISRVLVNKVTGVKYIQIQCLYAYGVNTQQDWNEGMPILRDFAIQEGAKYVTFDSRNEKVWKIAESVGFAETHRTYSIRIGGA